MKVVELFAGVGGFRIGLERVSRVFFNVVWSNQFEPSTKRQHASEVYVARFGGAGHVNEDIAKVPTACIPDHDMLCAGFPCQDYSVARTLSQAAGIEGKKGVLWWQIERVIREKGHKAPEILFLENVDRLLLSPAKQRGRDFAIILQTLSDQGYVVEWRVVNAADYGMPQRRRRIYILAYKEGSDIAREVVTPTEWLLNDGVLATAFPVVRDCGFGMFNEITPFSLKNENDDLVNLSDNFNRSNKTRPFANAGVMMGGNVWTAKVTPLYDGCRMTLGDVLARGAEHELVTEDYYIKDDELQRWAYLKGAKHEERKTKDGFVFNYSEGGMPFPDPLDRPSRTIITGEGGAAPSRFKHVVKDPVNGRLRRLLPVELERLNMFPDGHTAGQSPSKRAFFMGNALVCGVVTRIGNEIYHRLNR